MSQDMTEKTILRRWYCKVLKNLLFFKKFKFQTPVSPELYWIRPWFWLQWKEKPIFYKIQWFWVRLCHDTWRQGARPLAVPIWDRSFSRSDRSQLFPKVVILKSYADFTEEKCVRRCYCKVFKSWYFYLKKFKFQLPVSPELKWFRP